MRNTTSRSSLRSALNCAALFIITGGLAGASIVSTTGAIEIIPAPLSVEPGANVNVKDGQAFSERQDLTLSSALSVNATAAGTYSNGAGPGGAILAGADVNSYFVLFDSGGASVPYPSGTLTFSTKVLGVIFSDSLLDKSDVILGDPGTKYPTGVSSRGQEAGDSTTISASGFTVTLHDSTSSPGDDIRIITAAQPGSSVPEPATYLLFGIGLIVSACLMKRRRSLAD